MGNHLVMTTADNGDAVLLVDENDNVLSAWRCNAMLVDDYMRCAYELSYWEHSHFKTPIGKPGMPIEAYGRVIGHDGVIDDEPRKRYWDKTIERMDAELPPLPELPTKWSLTRNYFSFWYNIAILKLFAPPLKLLGYPVPPQASTYKMGDLSPISLVRMWFTDIQTLRDRWFVNLVLGKGSNRDFH